MPKIEHHPRFDAWWTKFGFQMYLQERSTVKQMAKRAYLHGYYDAKETQKSSSLESPKEFEVSLQEVTDRTQPEFRMNMWP